QGGVLRAPDGQITLGFFGTSNIAPDLAPDATTTQVVLLPGSITSVSMSGLTIPYGGTSDGTTYTLDGVTVSAGSTTQANTTFLAPPQLAINAQAIQVQAGATIDL